MTDPALIADLKEVFAKHNVGSAIFAVPLNRGQFFLMMHQAEMIDIRLLGMLLSQYMPEQERGTLN
jgi:hypothetical protein